MLSFLLYFFNVGVISSCYQERITPFCLLLLSLFSESCACFWAPQDKKFQQRPPSGYRVRGHGVQRKMEGAASIQSGEMKGKGEILWFLQLPTRRTWRDIVGGALWYNRRQMAGVMAQEALIRDGEKRCSQ